MIKQIVDACDEEVRMRVIDRDLDPALRDELRIMGAMRIPVVVFLTEDFFEVQRYERLHQTRSKSKQTQLR